MGTMLRWVVWLAVSIVLIETGGSIVELTDCNPARKDLHLQVDTTHDFELDMRREAYLKALEALVSEIREKSQQARATAQRLATFDRTTPPEEFQPSKR